MTIKEIEARSGIPRANIRYYESEGLLNPKRERNGYRNYSEQDLEELQKIKLLRALNISLEEVLKLHQGNADLPHTLEVRLQEIAKEQGTLEQSEIVCREMKDDGVLYETLDARRYLEKLEQLAKEAASKHSMGASLDALPEINLSWQQSDMVPKEYALWRRFWARIFDLRVYELIFICILALVFHMNPVRWMNGTSAFEGVNTYITTAAGFGLALLFEPLQLMLFGTTLGKWIMGIRVTGSEGERLSWWEGLRRTKSVICRGLGFEIPVWTLIRLWKSYQQAGLGRALDWEEESLIVVKDKKRLRFVGLAVGYLCHFAVIYAVACLAALPPNRGELTVAQFCENYNRMAEYYGLDNDWYLNETGYWTEKPKRSDMTVITIDLDRDILGDIMFPAFEFSEEDGKLTGISMSAQIENKEMNWPIGSYATEIILAIQAFVPAQKSYPVFLDQAGRLTEKVAKHPFDSFTCEIGGVTVSCRQELNGMRQMMDRDMMMATEEENSYRLLLHMEKGAE